MQEVATDEGRELVDDSLRTTTLDGTGDDSLRLDGDKKEPRSQSDEKVLWF